MVKVTSSLDSPILNRWSLCSFITPLPYKFYTSLIILPLDLAVLLLKELFGKFDL
jgi:hypothetical protein